MYAYAFATNYATAKVGVMPRLIDDFITESYRTYSTSSLSMPVVTTMCAEKCPVVNDVFCDYAFLYEMDDMLGAQGIWQTNPLQGDAKDKVRSALQQTADVNRAAVQLQLVTALHHEPSVRPTVVDIRLGNKQKLIPEDSH